jgi:transposase
MTEHNKSKKPPKVDLSKPDSLVNLDQATLIGIINSLYDQNRQLSELLQQFFRDKYGRKTERFVDSGQLTLFDTDQQIANKESVDPSAQKTKKSNTRRDRNPRPSIVTRIRTKVKELTQEELTCKCCGELLIKVNEIVVHSRYDYIPASTRIEDLIEEIYACPGCAPAVVSAASLTELIPEPQECDANHSDRTALALELAQWLGVTTQPEDPPSQIIDDAVAIGRSGMLRTVAQIARSQASPSMLSYIAVSKYCDHLPLYRLEEIFARQGTNISRSTMCGWLTILVALLRPLYDLMHNKLLLCKIIWTDDTPVKVLVRKLEKNIKTGRIWVYIGDESQPFNLFHYTPGRAREGPKKFLKGFKQYLQGDCFSGNEAICAENGATLVACNAHGRRYFVKAILNYKSKSEEALRFFQHLFEIEKTAKELGLNAADRKLMREQEAKPILDEFKRWLDAARLHALPKSSFGKAVGYCLNNWPALTAYLEDGDLSIDNNIAEQQMKRVACGRKSWLFLGSENGGAVAEVLLSIISTCKRHKVEPSAYLRAVIEQLIRNPQTDLEELLPHTWNRRAAKDPMAA